MQTLQVVLSQLADVVIAAPVDPSTAPAQPGGTVIDTKGVVGWLASIVAPILVGLLGIVILSRASKGQVSQSLTSSGIAMLGIALIVGGGALLLVGDDLVNLILS